MKARVRALCGFWLGTQFQAASVNALVYSQKGQGFPPLYRHAFFSAKVCCNVQAGSWGQLLLALLTHRKPPMIE